MFCVNICSITFLLKTQLKCTEMIDSQLQTSNTILPVLPVCSFKASKGVLT